MKEIKVLGTGCCSKCHNLYDTVKRKADELKLSVTLIKSNDIMEIIKYGIISTPAIVIDGKVVSFGSMLLPEQIEKLLKDNK